MRLLRPLLFAVAALVVLAPSARAQTVRMSDLVSVAGQTPRRVMGYGLVVGLDGTGDRTFGSSHGSTHTVQSVVNLLERFGVRVPSEYLRIRNVAAVVVTAEMSPYARKGSRFDVSVSSIGDARSLAGGVLWMTPLMMGPGQAPLASAQGTLLTTDNSSSYRRINMRGSAVVPEGGVLEVDLPAAVTPDTLRLMLNEPNIVTAARVRDAINQVIGQGTAVIEDPGTIRIDEIPGGSTAMDVLAQIQELRVQVMPDARIVVDARTGSVVAGGSITVGPASVTSGEITLTVGGEPPITRAVPDPANPAQAAPVGAGVPTGRAFVAEGAAVQDVVGALHDAGARPAEIAQVLLALQRVGAINAEVELR